MLAKPFFELNVTIVQHFVDFVQVLNKKTYYNSSIRRFYR